MINGCADDTQKDSGIIKRCLWRKGQKVSKVLVHFPEIFAQDLNVSGLDVTAQNQELTHLALTAKTRQ